MNRFAPLLVLALAAASTLGAQALEEGVAPPPLSVDESPNPRYEEELKDRIHRLPEGERRAFFRRLRRQQRELRGRLLEMEANLSRARDLRKALAQDGSGLAPRTDDLIQGQREALALYRAMERAIVRERRAGDPQQIDAEDLQADLYAGFQFSSLYRDPDQATSFFSKSRPFVSLDIRQTIRWPGRDRWVEAFGTLSFQSSSKETSDAVAVITTSGSFRGEAGAWWMRSLTETVSWGVVGTVGLVGYSTPQTEADLEGSSRDEFRNRSRVGLTLRQESGALRGSVAEVAFLRDPQFVARDRLLVRGRVVLTQFGSQVGSGDFYIEGFVSKGRSGRDEAVLQVGLRLSTLSFFRSLGVGG